jgi:F-type H+-transporting ATPase subunit gamma
MPSLKAVRLRIASVKSTQKITSAMKMVAAAKLRRSQDAIVAARPYAKSMADITAEVAARAAVEDHPLLEWRSGKRVALIVLTSDRGLCGGFNSNLCRAAQRYAEEKTLSGEVEEVRFEVVGRKGRDYFRRRKLNLTRDLPGAAGDTAMARAKELAAIATEEFLNGAVDAVWLVYNQFRSVISQKPTIEPLLPVAPAVASPSADGSSSEFLFEPGKGQILDYILPMYVETQIHRALLESVASEFGAKMTAMENATKNATEMIARLTLQYNRARQASITKELMEIVGGAEALKG